MKKLSRQIASFSVFFVFIVFGVWEIINPGYWAGFVPSFVSTSLAPLLVRIHGVVLSIIAIWLITGFKRRIAGIFASLVMLDICVSLFISSGFSDLLVRDIAILIFAVSIIFDAED